MLVKFTSRISSNHVISLAYQKTFIKWGTSHVRAHFSKRFRDISSYGYCASKKETYYGLKLHAAVNLEGYLADL